MQRTWYKRMLLSFFPLLLVTISAIIFISFLVVSEISMKQAEKANRISTNYVVDVLQSTVLDIESRVLKEIETNPRIADFMTKNPAEDMRLTQYYLSNEIQKIVENNPYVHSIYLYRADDDRVLTQSFLSNAGGFTDQSFIRQTWSTDYNPSWSPQRMYTDSSLTPAERVITLSKRTPLPLGSQGLVVVNVDVKRLLSIVDGMLNQELSALKISDSSGTVLYAAGEDDGANHAGSMSSLMDSSVLGWTFESGLRAGQLFGWVSVISYIWIIIAALIVVASMIAAVYVFKRNYKPVELIMERIQQYQLRNLQKTKGYDEFSFIEKALESLAQQTMDYERKHQEDVHVRRKQFIRDLLEGQRTVTAAEWSDNAASFKLPHSFQRAVVAVMEIDKFSEFQTVYPLRDQNLLKFALTNAVHESVQQEHRHAWAEWLSNDRMVLICSFEKSGDNEEERLAQLLTEFSRWVPENLKFSVTIALGAMHHGLDGIQTSFRQALHALQYKLLLGEEKLIHYFSRPTRTGAELPKYYLRIAESVQHFRMLNDTWWDETEAIFQHVRDELLTDEEIRAVMRYWIHLLQTEFQDCGHERSGPDVQALVGSLHTVVNTAGQWEELASAFSGQLTGFYRTYHLYRSSRKHRQILLGMREYIEKNYANPELSLIHLSEKFDISAKYASQLFKDEYGINFVDFLVQLRMQEAKNRLHLTDESINGIAVRVGYTNAVSFGRMFKRVIGVTPGDYRKLKQT
ncbi:helix-turn-helix domain-containing protein [Paenibacillus xerothermodurans]|uniref:Helix-turn-helix domain-containing protein n=1 Tax=Paenibacillus xerothermodurans TaxID=1977292 RepID=A0A2W1NV69_PAEXE|nr:helix-turn-helix domain-containing protein [Paenibacillus xerothermodurans]PZE21656.1 helix-turn-helix domain-containing protein [Paenibacillus xerothermodurans]